MPVIASPIGDEFKAVLGSNNIARPNLDPVNECAACGSVIADRFYLLAVDRKWHEKCLQCYHCKKPLEDQEKCYCREGQIYCRDDYFNDALRCENNR
ncbi:lim homeobox protein-like protein [Leptotrombidium deliense]|uniref:Lim homeobox protein-like protein n=1 Tax=Leptotrombidium deliense TaxID=299467 RepID=A0A443S8S2_9ACAR|nr:lim homeobox protein-like protein [Leptotrombidium deliense]